MLSREVSLEQSQQPRAAGDAQLRRTAALRPSISLDRKLCTPGDREVCVRVEPARWFDQLLPALEQSDGVLLVPGLVHPAQGLLIETSPYWTTEKRCAR